MIYSWTTIKPVIGRVVRNVRDIDGSYYDDFQEWIPEAIGKLKTHYQLELVCAPVEIRFHQGRLPCSMEGLAAVEYNGKRLPESGTVGDLRRNPVNNPGNCGPATVVQQIKVKTYSGEEVHVEGLETKFLTDLSSMGFSNDGFYRINYNKIESNIENGTLNVYYWKSPSDEDGFPMIPDNENYKEAIYWYCRMMMIGAGFEDTVFRYGDCEARWERYAARAIGEITYPTPDRVARNVRTNVRLISNEYIWDDFNNTTDERSYLDN